MRENTENSDLEQTNSKLKRDIRMFKKKKFRWKGGHPHIRARTGLRVDLQITHQRSIVGSETRTYASWVKFEPYQLNQPSLVRYPHVQH